MIGDRRMVSIENKVDKIIKILVEMKTETDMQFSIFNQNIVKHLPVLDKMSMTLDNMNATLKAIYDSLKKKDVM